MGKVVYLAQNDKFAEHIGKALISSLKEKGRQATIERASAFWVSAAQTKFWAIVNKTVSAYLAHSKIKVKD